MFKPGFPQAVQGFLYDMFAADDKHILVGEENGQTIAFACLAEMEVSETPYRPARRYLEVDEVGVDTSARGRGAGRQLFEAIRCFAKERGFQRIELNMWEFNENALHFYETIGFATFRRYMEMPVD